MTATIFTPEDSHRAASPPPLADAETPGLARSGAWTLGATLLAGLLGGLYVFAGWALFRQFELPAYSISWVLKGLSIGATVVVFVVIAATVLWWLLVQHRGQTQRIITTLVTLFAPASLVLTMLALPLSGTRLWIEGIQVDQSFRTVFFTRLTDTLSLEDMAYMGEPSFYPAGWFIFGGRLANLLGMPGWEAYQPASLISLGIAGTAIVPVWYKLTGSPALTLAVSSISMLLIIPSGAHEPYAAPVALWAPAALIIAERAFRGSRWATGAITAILGISACCYTLYTATTALSVVALGFVHAWQRKSWRPLARLTLIGLLSLGIAASVWGPYVWARLTGQPADTPAAARFLPDSSADFHMPMFSDNAGAVLCLVGLIFVAAAFRVPAVRALGVGLLVTYGWVLASQVATLFDTTLLSFRMATILLMLFGTAGVLSFAYLHEHRDLVVPQLQRSVAAIIVVGSVAGATGFVSSFFEEGEESFVHAYADTDGYGDRADRKASKDAKYLPLIDEYLREHGFVPNETVVLSDEGYFFSYFPYFAFQAMTPHYANPLGQYTERGEALKELADLSWDDPEAVTAKLDSLPWRAPDAFILRDRTDKDYGWKYTLVEDKFPDDPNVRFTDLYFNPEAFAGAAWETQDFGPFMVVHRV